MRVGIMGGTFDPVHAGHLAVARAAMEDCALDRVVFLPDGDPPHKRPAASGGDRLAMIREAVSEDSRFSVSDMELKRAGRTYTVDTLVALREETPGTLLTYLVGSDTFFLFSTWREPGKVAALCDFCVILRPGDSRRAVQEARERYLRAYGLTSRLLKSPGPGISSSAVRAAAARGLPLAPMVPPAVEDYIRKKGLYGAPLSPASGS